MRAKIIGLLLLVISFGANASQDFKCLANTNKTGFAYELKRVFENEEKAQYTFLTRFGSCESGHLEAETFKRKKGKVRVYDDALHIPFFRKTLAKVSIEDFASDREFMVTFTINKENSFKKKNKKRNFGVHIFINKKKHKFIFGFEAELDKDGEVILKLVNPKAMKSFTV
jgi:hypothetical protein